MEEQLCTNVFISVFHILFLFMCSYWVGMWLTAYLKISLLGIQGGFHFSWKMDSFSLDITHLLTSDLEEMRAREHFLILTMCNLSLCHLQFILVTPHLQRLALLPSVSVCHSAPYMMGRKGSTGVFQILSTGYSGISLTTVPAWWTLKSCHMNNLWGKVPTTWLF